MRDLQRSHYSIWGALFVEFFLVLTRAKPELKKNKFLAKMAQYWWPDWAEWKTERTMNGVDDQAADLVKAWEEQDTAGPIYTEEPSDGSKAQELLGGPMRSRRPWVDK